MTPIPAQARESELACDTHTMSDQIRDMLARARWREIQLETAFREYAPESASPCRVGI